MSNTESAQTFQEAQHELYLKSLNELTTSLLGDGLKPYSGGGDVEDGAFITENGVFSSLPASMNQLCLGDRLVVPLSQSPGVSYGARR
jgi:hypothetical protein